MAEILDSLALTSPNNARGVTDATTSSLAEIRELFLTESCSCSSELSLSGDGSCSERPSLSRFSSSKELGKSWSLRKRNSDSKQAYLPPLSNQALALQVLELARKGGDLLADLNNSSKTAPAMPGSALHKSKGLAFVWETKAGLGASVVWGSGFIVARLGGGHWSAPCFFTNKSITVGATAGYLHKGTCYALPNEASLESFTKTGALKSVTAPTVSKRKVLTTSPSKIASQPYVYQVVDGAMVDCSLRLGGRKVDHTMNEKVYGKDVTPDNILDGNVHPPTEFERFYSLLTELAKSAELIRRQESKFDLLKTELNRSSTSITAGSLIGSAYSSFTFAQQPPHDDLTEEGRVGISPFVLFPDVPNINLSPVTE